MQTIRIRKDRPYFWQWDQNQQVEIAGVNGPCQVHFTQQDSTEDCLVVEPQYEGNLWIANVPNILLQTAAPITVYVYRCDEARYTDRHIVFNVAAREKPTDYVYTETEVLTWEALKRYCEERAVTPDLQIGKVTTLPAGSPAEASITGTDTQPILHLGIPTGSKGETGDKGDKGDSGISPTVQVADVENGHRVTITDVDGAHSFDVMDGAVASGVSSVNGKTGAITLSASDVGAAPSGYGYGEAPYLIRYTDDSDGSKLESALDTLLNKMADGEVRQIRVVSYPNMSGSMWVGTLYKNTYEYASLIGATYNTRGSLIQKIKRDGIWQPHEWVNPSTVVGSPDRSTERWDGKAVYVKLIDCATLGDAAKYVDTGVVRDSYDVVSFEGFVYTTPSAGYQTSPIVTRADVEIVNHAGSTSTTTNYYIKVNDTNPATAIQTQTCRVVIKYTAK